MSSEYRGRWVQREAMVINVFVMGEIMFKQVGYTR